MRRNRHIWSAFFAAAALVSSSGISSAKDSSIAGGAGYTIERENGSQALRIRTHAGANIDTRKMAKAIGITPHAIRAENPTKTLALCKTGGRFAMSPGLRTVEDRRSNAVWERCSTEQQYVYMLPSSTLTVSGSTYRSFSEQQDVLGNMGRCSTAACAIEEVKKIAVGVREWPIIENVNGSDAPSVVRVGETTPSRPLPAQPSMSTFSAARTTFLAALVPVIRGISLHLMGSLAGLLAVCFMGFLGAVHKLRRMRSAKGAAEREIVQLRITKDRLELHSHQLATERDYYKKAHQYVAERLVAQSNLPAAQSRSAAEQLRGEREEYRRASESERKRANALDAEFRNLVRSVRTACGEESAPVYIDRMPAPLLARGAVELIRSKLGLPASIEGEKPGHVTQRMFAVMPSARTTLSASKEDSGIRRKVNVSESLAASETASSSIIGREYQSSFPSIVKTERNMPVVKLPLVHAGEPAWEYEADASAPYQWPGSTKLGIGERRIPKAPTSGITAA